MTIDMSQFHGVFLEESAEHLDEIEHLLMALDPEHPEIEDLNCIFRAAHSIKGGAGIFGFDALISVTHVMENLFDQARQGQFHISQQIVNELLIVVDTLRRLLEAYGSNDAINWQLVADATEKVNHLLQPAVAAKSEVSSSDTDSGFGFFEPLVSKSADENDQAFGFFEPLSAAIEDDGFGFFEPITASTEAMVDDGFGFFAPLDPPTQTPAAALSEQAKTSAESTAEAMAKPAISAASSQQAAKPVVVETEHKPIVEKRKTDTDSSSIRVDIHKVDSLVNLVGELVITQSMLTLIGEELAEHASERLATALRELERNTRDLQEGIMSIRMLPMSFVFNRFPRVVRDLSQKLNKNVELVIEGGHTEIDKGLIEKLVDPLTHLVRNSLDHGIESAETRRTLGKAETGRLVLKAEQKGGNILISVQDDGGGLNRHRIIAKARERGIEISDNAPDTEVWQLIMAPGFSTAEQVTDVSGRGVGMDVVRRNIESMGGKIDITSVTGQGSGIHIRLPLTLAILDGMSVSVSTQQFIVPLVNIVESVQPLPEQLMLISNQQMLFLRDLYWPIVRLGELMQLPDALTDPVVGILVLVESSRNRFAMLVDDLLGQQQVVIKSLEQHYRRVDGVAGATIMGDGSVALILDVESLADIPATSIN
jgi:two-component system chemotaxis sensor kinase CheA